MYVFGEKVYARLITFQEKRKKRKSLSLWSPCECVYVGNECVCWVGFTQTTKTFSLHSFIPVNIPPCYLNYILYTMWEIHIVNKSRWNTQFRSPLLPVWAWTQNSVAGHPFNVTLNILLLTWLLALLMQVLKVPLKGIIISRSKLVFHKRFKKTSLLVHTN